MTLVYGHRGASAQRPENTVEAFRHAEELGAGGVELDVHVAGDGSLAVVHDPQLPDGRLVNRLVAAELPSSVPLLDAALAACGSLTVNVEIKQAPVAPVIDAIRRWGGEAVVSSFDARVVDEVRAVAPDVATAQLTFLPDRPVGELVAWIASRGHGRWNPYAPALDADGVGLARAAGLGVITWTVDDPVRIAELASWGVEAIITNDIPTALEALGRA
jgi:glycerophosphoryl diester phosphodiesterase